MGNQQSSAGGFSPVPTGRLYLGSDQLNLVSGTPTDILLDTIDTDFTDGIEDTVNNKIVPGVAGYYLIIAQASFKNVIADKNYSLKITIGGLAKRFISKHSALVADVTVLCSGIFKLTKTSYIKANVVSEAAVDTVDLWGNSMRTFLSVQRVR